MHELHVCLAQFEFDGSQVASFVIIDQSARGLAVRVGHKPSPSDVMHVIGKSTSSSQIEVFVRVLLDQPVTITCQPVELAIANDHFGGKVITRRSDHEFEASAPSRLPRVVYCEIAPCVQEVANSVASAPELTWCEGHNHDRNRNFLATGHRMLVGAP